VALLPVLYIVVPFRALVILETVYMYQGDPVQCCFKKNRHKSKTDYLTLDRKKWDFQIRIILIQIKCFEQLAQEDSRSNVSKAPFTTVDILRLGKRRNHSFEMLLFIEKFDNFPLFIVYNCAV